MNSAHVHLILNHLPLAGILFSIPLLAVAVWRKSDSLGVTGLISVLISGILTIPTYLSGRPTEELVEHVAGVSETLIQIHEEAAEKAIWVIGVAAVFALAGLMVRYYKKRIPNTFVVTVLLLSLCSAGFLVWTNTLGGEIHHSEIRNNASTLPPSSVEKNETDGD